MKLENKYISLIKNYFRNKPVLKAYLFGSYVRNEANKKSDIDLLVELDYSKPIGMEFIQMALELEDLLKRKVDLVSSKAVSKRIQPYIEQEKKLIYDRQNSG